MLLLWLDRSLSYQTSLVLVIIFTLNHFRLQLMTYFLFQHIREPMRYREKEAPSLLDLTNEQDMISNLVYLSLLGNSDHICTEFDLNCCSEPNKYYQIRKYNSSTANIDLMKQALSNVDWVTSTPTLMSPAWLLFKLSFQSIIDEYVPIYKQR